MTSFWVAACAPLGHLCVALVETQTVTSNNFLGQSGFGDVRRLLGGSQGHKPGLLLRRIGSNLVVLLVWVLMDDVVAVAMGNEDGTMSYRM